METEIDSTSFYFFFTQDIMPYTTVMVKKNNVQCINMPTSLLLGINTALLMLDTGAAPNHERTMSGTILFLLPFLLHGPHSLFFNPFL